MRLETKEELIEQSSVKYMLCGLVALIVIAIITVLNINKTGFYPWGENVFNYIYHKNIPLSFNIIVGLNIVIGGFGFILWGVFFKRRKLCFVFAALWFFIPTNLRVLFSEGNVPIAFINSIIPYLILAYYNAITEKKNWNYFLLTVVVIVMTFLNATITIMLLILLYLAILARALVKKVDKHAILILSILTVVVLVLRFTIIEKYQNWILPKSVEHLIFPIETSFNPFVRFENIQVFYIGISFLLVALFGIIFSANKNKERWLFFMAVILFIVTSSRLGIFFDKIPINEFLVFSRISSLGVAFIFLGIVLWINLNKLILIGICFFMSMDAFATFQVIGFNRDLPRELMQELDIAAEIVANKVAVLDLSTYGSFVNYYLKIYGGLKEEQLIFNRKWMSADNKDELIRINSALENDYYLFMFDKTLENEVDTLIIKKAYIEDEISLQEAADKVGYEKIYEDDGDYIYKYPIENEFITNTRYEAIGIGKYASNIVYNFPNIVVGDSNYLEDYSIEELKQYKTIYLSGFKYRDEKKAEEMLYNLSNMGIRVVVDIVDIDSNGFLGVVPQSIVLANNYGEIYYKGEKIILEDFTENIKIFKTNYISNIVAEENYAIEKTMVINYLNYKNENLILLGLNIPYYLFHTKDKEAIRIMEDVLNMKANELPIRELGVGEVE